MNSMTHENKSKEHISVIPTETFVEIFQERTNSLQWAKKGIFLQLVFTLSHKTGIFINKIIQIDNVNV